MIRIDTPLPKDHIYVACSGGVDSIAALHFLRLRRTYVTAVFFHHGTPYCDAAYDAVLEYCGSAGITVATNKYDYQVGSKPKGKSLEEFWRDCRYAYLETMPGVVVTAHTLDDQVETYLMSAMHGSPKLIPYYRNNVVRPFLTTRKQDLVRWALKHDLNWYEDPSNQSNDHMRNYVRHELVPRALHVNPGLYKTVKKMVEHQLTLQVLGNV